ncbi:MAG: transporter substrate-binding domain-containing protein [Phascolarctobacterium sp.]|nr:transporter substrate-binding domain-containing protein [Phascolarctobacterium sp.]
MKKLFAVLMMIICVFALTACGGGQKKADVAKVLKVGTDANFPPFEYYQKNSKVFTGFDIDLIQAMAKQMGYTKVEFVPTDFDKILTDLDAKKYDLAIAGMAITPERQTKYVFSDAYLTTGFIAIGHKEGTPFTKAEAAEANSPLNGKRIAAEKNSHFVELAKEYTKDVIECRSTEDGIKMVAAGAADYVITDKYVGRFFVTNGYNKNTEIAAELKGDGTVKNNALGIAMRKEDSKLQADVNKALHEVKRSGEFKNLTKTYFGE